MMVSAGPTAVGKSDVAAELMDDFRRSGQEALSLACWKAPKQYVNVGTVETRIWQS